MKTYTFNSTNPYWDKNSDVDMLILHAKQNYFNDKLHADGYVLFSDVLTGLALPVDDSISDDWKWELNNDNDDPYVDFGIEEGPDKGVFTLNFNIRDMTKTCSNCKHSCYVDTPGTDESVLVCVNGESYNAFTRVSEKDSRDCWESVKEVNNG